MKNNLGDDVVIMCFFEQYVCNEAFLEDAITTERGAIKAGTYNNIVKFLRKKEINLLCEIWSWKFNNEYVPVASNMFGDLFLCSLKDKSIYYFQPQGGEIIHLCDSLDDFVNSALCHESIIVGLLKEHKVFEVYKHIGKVSFEEIYILCPWEIFGGKDDVQNYKIGNGLVYHDLLSQTLKKYSL